MRNIGLRIAFLVSVISMLSACQDTKPPYVHVAGSQGDVTAPLWHVGSSTGTGQGMVGLWARPELSANGEWCVTRVVYLDLADGREMLGADGVLDEWRLAPNRPGTRCDERRSDEFSLPIRSNITGAEAADVLEAVLDHQSSEVCAVGDGECAIKARAQLLASIVQAEVYTPGSFRMDMASVRWTRNAPAELGPQEQGLLTQTFSVDANGVSLVSNGSIVID